MVGQYVYLAGNWRYIGQVTDSKTAALNAEMSSTGTGYGYIAPMNLITISGDGVAYPLPIGILAFVGCMD